MLDHLLDTPPGDRKARLFAAACCRQVWHLLDVRGRNAVEAVERYADGMASNEELASASLAAFGVYEAELGGAGAIDGPAGTAAYFLTRSAPLVGADGRLLPFDSVRKAVIQVVKTVRECRIAPGRVASLLRDTIGNPFRPVPLNPAWLTATVVSLAQQMYRSRDFSPMPILADAMQDAGCDNADILNHCRSDGLHVRGCWAVDLLMGKE